MHIWALILVAIAAREIYLMVWLDRSARIRIKKKGWLVVEVRRRVTMEHVPQHVSDFPSPREERILVKKLLGMVLSHREVSVALPESACDHLEKITPQEFDGQFPNWLRLADA
jgi:hypothetical protein